MFKRADGYWCGSVEAGRYPSGGRRRARVVRRTKAEVLAALDELKRRAGNGNVGPDPAVGDFVTWWVENVAAPTVTPSTLTTYRARHRAWIEGYPVERVRLRKLRATDVQSWLNDLAAADIAPRSRNAAKTLLSSALKYAEGAGIIDRNPAVFVKSAQAGAKLDDALTPDELATVKAAARGDRLEALWLLLLTYGLRPVEALALTWDAVDLDAGTLRVTRSKTAAGLRELPLLADMVDAIRAHRDRQAVESDNAGSAWIESGRVFTTPDGRPLPRRTWSDAWHALLKRAGVTDRRPYAARHSAATSLLEAGVPLEVVSAILGHSGLSITADVYARVRDDLKRRGLSALDGAG